MQVVPAGSITQELIDGWEKHESMVYAYTRRYQDSLEQLRSTFASANWKEGDGGMAISHNPRPSFPGFFDPGGMMRAPLYMRHEAGNGEMWAFANGAVFVRRRIAPNQRWSVPIVEKR